MNRRELLSHACGMGMCSCAASALFSETCLSAQKNTAESSELQKLQTELNRAQWWLGHAKRQFAKLWELLEPHLDEKTRLDLIEKLGRNCAQSLGWGEQYKGNPEGFFDFMNKRFGETMNYDKDKGIITVTTLERDCECRLVDSKITPPYFCHCSVGWQKQMYEAILGKSVEVQVKESVLRGSKRCVFEIRILQESAS